MDPSPCDYSGLEKRCHGTGYLECRCGGDQCYCGFQGEAECYGCPDCEFDEDEAFPYDDDERAP